MSPLVKFLSYNNAVPIAISVALLGAGGAFAATDPGAIYSANQQVISIDNTYLVNKDLSTYSPRVEITGVTEDADNYYVAYKLYTIDLQNYVWQDVVRTDTMQVSKADLGQFRDLGVYVTGKLADIVAREHDRLVATQADARAHVSQEVVATQYGGLVGKFLDTSTQVLPGYTPVVQPPPVAVATGGNSQSAAAASSQQPTNTQNSASQTQNPNAPVLQILGNNPAQVPLHSTYVDLGAIIVSPANSNLGIHVIVNGTEVTQVAIDTSKVATWNITYQVTDQNGNVGTATREVDVFDPSAAPAQSATSTPSTAATSTQSQPAAPANPAPQGTTSESSATSTPSSPDTTPAPAATSTTAAQDTGSSSASSTPSSTDTGSASSTNADVNSSSATSTQTSSNAAQSSPPATAATSSDATLTTTDASTTAASSTPQQ